MKYLLLASLLIPLSISAEEQCQISWMHDMRRTNGMPMAAKNVKHEIWIKGAALPMKVFNGDVREFNYTAPYKCIPCNLLKMRTVEYETNESEFTDAVCLPKPPVMCR